MTRQMTMRTYKATVRKAHEAYTALLAAKDGARHSEYGARERISMALDPMQAAVNALRPQVCERCNDRGYFKNPEGPGERGCLHPDVPFYDISTGEVKS